MVKEDLIRPYSIASSVAPASPPAEIDSNIETMCGAKACYERTFVLETGGSDDGPMMDLGSFQWSHRVRRESTVSPLAAISFTGSPYAFSRGCLMSKYR